MTQPPTHLADEVGIAFGNMADAATGLFTPTLRLGVTGLSRAGKTIFITALIHNLLTNGRMPGFSPLVEGRLVGAKLTEYPDREIPRFAYEQHLAAFTAKKPHWPASTRRISQIRLTLKYQSQHWLTGLLGPRQIHLDIIDYPGEWLLDLPLLSLSFAEWSEQTLACVHRPSSAKEAALFLKTMSATDLAKDAQESDAQALAAAFTQYLHDSRKDGRALSTLPPGRFLLPGDLEGSPALTFAPAPTPSTLPNSASLYAMLERRYEAYKDIVVRPFFREHFARLDRQIVLVDTLRALNAGPEAVADLENAMTNILSCYRQGAANPLMNIVSKRIDRILFAASKADHVHHSSHDRLEAILNKLVANAARRARFSGALTSSIALAAVRATREDEISERGEDLKVIIGTPEKGEILGDIRYDGKTEIALFPGDLPKKPESAFKPDKTDLGLNFMRFLPPQNLAHNPQGDPILPHIRFDKALDYLMGDWLA